MDCPAQARPFRLRGELAPTPSERINAVIESIAVRLFALRRLDRLYDELDINLPPRAFLERILDALRIRYEVTGEDLARVPALGPAVVVANHPFGAIEGMILAHLLGRIRPDVRVMANYLLKRIPELRDLFISVDPFGGPGAAWRNYAPLRESLRWLEAGGCLVVFPAGAISHAHLSTGRVVDPPWHPSIGRLIAIAKVPVVPVYFEGANSLLFQLLGLLHPRLRTAMIPRELVNKGGRLIPVRLGHPLPFERLQGFRRPGDLARYLRLSTYLLGEEKGPGPLPRAVGARASPRSCDREPVVEAPPAGLLAAEIAALPPDQCLCSSGRLQVYCARASQIPWLLREIGRLRELSFRAVGEGTGRSIDIDLYDSYYSHLFLWSPERREVAGAYRLAATDEVLARYGRRGLYTHSLFRFRRPALAALNPALELGRSFVRPEYQRSFAPLLLLWRGIGQYVARNPRYRLLFGPVSISAEYRSRSRRLLVDFLRVHRFESGLARHIKPRHPFRAALRREWSGSDLAGIDDLEAWSQLLARIEPDEKGVPVLLKQYLKLGGRLLGFNVDAHFNNALDGLIVVDLTRTEPAVLQRYMGREAAGRFLAFHEPPGYRRVS